MLKDRYDLALTTASAAARDAYVQASGLALTFYPGALEAYDRAIAADPGFALAHAGKALVLLRQGDVAAARAALATAKGLASGVSEREASHIAYFELVFAGETEAAIAALHPHLAAWPRDALVLASAANPNGLIGGSGRIGQKREIAALMDSLAPHYGDDFWFGSYHAMALSEDGQFRVGAGDHRAVGGGEPEQCPRRPWRRPHLLRDRRPRGGRRSYLSSWLATYPRDGFFHGHLSWHLSLFEIQAGNWTEARRLYADALALDRHSGGPQQKISDGAAFLWRSELAGQPRDAAAWRALHDYAKRRCRGRERLYDLHVILAQSVMADEAAPDARARQIEALAREGRYLSGAYLPALARGFAAFEREDFSAAIEALAPLVGENERIGGSRAQHDLIEFTLLSACLSANRLDKARICSPCGGRARPAFPSWALRRCVERHGVARRPDSAF